MKVVLKDDYLRDGKVVLSGKTLLCGRKEATELLEQGIGYPLGCVDGYNYDYSTDPEFYSFSQVIPVKSERVAG